MNGLRKKIEANYLFGAIKYRNKCNIYLMPIAYWILNYAKYDPSYNTKEWEFVFRANVLNVSDENIDDFLRAVQVDWIDFDTEKSEIRALPKELIRFYFFVDLDTKTYISSFLDIDIEEYLPDRSWTAKFDDPTGYLPNNLKELFNTL